MRFRTLLNSPPLKDNRLSREPVLLHPDYKHARDEKWYEERRRSWAVSLRILLRRYKSIYPTLAKICRRRDHTIHDEVDKKACKTALESIPAIIKELESGGGIDCKRHYSPRPSRYRTNPYTEE